MNHTTIITDHKEKQFRYRDEVPAKVLAEDFDWLDDDTYDGFILYRRNWYHISEFLHAPDSLKLLGWDGYHGDSFFSGIAIQLADDGETYKIALILS